MQNFCQPHEGEYECTAGDDFRECGFSTKRKAVCLFGLAAARLTRLKNPCTCNAAIEDLNARRKLAAAVREEPPRTAPKPRGGPKG